MAPSRHDWKIVDRDVKPQHNQPTNVSEAEQAILSLTWSQSPKTGFLVTRLIYENLGEEKKKEESL